MQSQTREHLGASADPAPLTLCSGLRPAGPGNPGTSLLLLQGCPDIVLQAVGLLLEQTCPHGPTVRDIGSSLAMPGKQGG